MDASIGLAFTAGLLSALNPCAVGMLPAYLALRTSTGPASGLVAVVVAQAGGLIVGFVGTFSLIALTLALFGRGLLTAVPFIAGAIGIALVTLGIATLAGRPFHLRLPAIAVRGGTGVGGQALFGATYALASLGCALPVFLGFTAAALAQRELPALVATVTAFSAGSAVTLLGLVLIAAWVNEDGGLVPTRGLARYGGGGLLIAGGAYLLWVQLTPFIA
ncbi:MAG: hypothetical protein HYU87_07765 [Chloroflexi bacterium]|nr:hypothetical protein [Chloroflexota bacterium]